MTAALILLAGCATSGELDHPIVPTQTTIDPPVEAFLQEMVGEEHFSGGVLVMQDGRVRHASGYGLATTSRPNDLETAFHVASLTKQITAAAILRLVEGGAVELHQSINKYLPAKYRSPAWSAVTIHHLLSHSSGITDYAVAESYYVISDGFASDRTIAGMIHEAMAKDLEFMPGSRFVYSNMGYVLLGEIIETQANEPYADYVERNILSPMLMHASRIRREGHTPAKNDATGFRWNDDRALMDEDRSETLPATSPDAGLITTLGDFARWSQIFVGGDQRILTGESVAAMKNRQIEMGRGGAVDAYGYGIGVGERLLAHSGHVVGFRSEVILDQQTNTLILVFSNNSAVDMDAVGYGLLTLLLSPAS